MAEKITAKSTFTKLFQPSDAATSTLITVASPSTSGPSPFANQIYKNEDYDKFGKIIKKCTLLNTNASDW